MTIFLKTSSAGSASVGFSDIHATTARMSGITSRVLRPVPAAEARIPIRGRHNLRYAREKPWVETRGFSLAGGWVAGWVRCRGIGGFLLPWPDKSYVPLSATEAVDGAHLTGWQWVRRLDSRVARRTLRLTKGRAGRHRPAAERKGQTTSLLTGRAH